MYVLLTALFWATFFLPGFACLRGVLPGFRRVSRLLAPLPSGGLLHQIAYGYAFSFGLLSPVSLLCYAFSAPLWVFSAALCALSLLAVVGLVRARSRLQRRRSSVLLRAEPLALYALLAGLLWLQSRLGGWLDGDATFHLGRIRVLMEHGFSNRDIYLREYHFQHAYHSNLLFAVYASAAQLTGQSYLASWFYSEAWAKLLVASGHFVLGHTLTRRRSVGYALAAVMLTLNAGETYALYPNTLCVGYLLPLLLALGFSSLSLRESWLGRRVLLMALLSFVVAQLHALYVIYAGLTLGPALALAVLRRQSLRLHVLRVGVLCSFAAAAPFIGVSMFGFRDAEQVQSAPEDIEPPKVQAAPPAGVAAPPKPVAQEQPALVAGGGHLEKVLESLGNETYVFSASRMGGKSFVLAGFLALFASAALFRRRSRSVLAAASTGAAFSLPLAAAGLSAAWLGALLFTQLGATWAVRALQAPFIAARLSTVLTSLLVLGGCACVMFLAGLVRRGRWLVEPMLYVVLCAGATQLLGHAPKSFREHVEAAWKPEPERHVLLDRWLARRALLTRTIPAGSVVLTTPRQARYVVMLCDCYVLAADRGHTGISGIDKRRRDLTFMNSTEAPWEQRAQLIEYYGVRLVTFERRWQRRYRWAYQHGTLLGSEAGQDVIELKPLLAQPRPAERRE